MQWKATQEQDRETRGSLPPTRSSSSTRRLWSHAVPLSLTLASWLLLVAVVAQWVLIRFLGDVWWLGTIALFAPRWPLLAPLAVIAVLCAVWLRKLLWLNSASALLLLGPVMGFCLPLSTNGAGSDELPICVLTANLGGVTNVKSLGAQIQSAAPDVIAFQEFPSQIIEQLQFPQYHWETARGLGLASRFPILETQVFEGRRLGHYHDYGLRSRMRTPAGEVWIFCVYLDSPRDGLESLVVTRRGLFGDDALRKNTQQREEQSRLVSDWVSEVDGPAIVAGDMNQPAESYFHRRDWASWRDAYATVGLGYGHTWFSSWHGLRIDHVLASEHWHVKNCRVTADIGGDHRPVVAELALRTK